MELAILDEKLRYFESYIEYRVPGVAGQGPAITILVPVPDTGGVAILFIPEMPGTSMPPDFLQNTVRLHWRTLGSHVSDFVFYSFDSRTGNPHEYTNPKISNLHNGQKAYLHSATEYKSMFCDNNRPITRIQGGTVDAAQDAKEMGCVEGDFFELLAGLDAKKRAQWMESMKIHEKNIPSNPGIHIRALFEENLKDPVAFLPYIINPDGSVWIKTIWQDCRRLGWRHARRVLFRSVHERLSGKFLTITCCAEDWEFIEFLKSYGYEDFECNYWSGEYTYEVDGRFD